MFGRGICETRGTKLDIRFHTSICLHINTTFSHWKCILVLKYLSICRLIKGVVYILIKIIINNKCTVQFLYSQPRAHDGQIHWLIDWLIDWLVLHLLLIIIILASCYGFSYYYRFSDIAINSVNPNRNYSAILVIIYISIKVLISFAWLDFT
jgi:hypothetical protein